jgi:hypothetical protein
LRGILSYETGDLPAAEALNRSARLPRDAAVAFNLGAIHEELAQRDQAVAGYTAAIETRATLTCGSPGATSESAVPTPPPPIRVPSKPSPPNEPPAHSPCEMARLWPRMKARQQRPIGLRGASRRRRGDG